MDIKLLLNVLIFLIIGIYIQKIQCINFNNLKEADLIEVDNLFNNWNDYIDTKQRIIIGCFDSDNGIEYDNFIKAINSIESLETKKGLISSKKYSTIFNSNILNSYLGKKGINDIYVEAPEILVFKKDATNHILKYYYSADNNFREDSISKFIVESASEPMTKLEDIQLIDNYYYYIDSDNNHASLYSMEKPFIYLNLKNLNNKYISDVFNVLRQFKNQFNVVYTDENNFIRPPFENLKFSPLSIIKNVKKRGLEEAFDSSQFSDSYVTTIYHYTENMSENVYHQDLSYDFLIDFVNKYNNNTLIPQKPKKHFENQLNNKVIEFKYNDYVLELNNHNFIDVTGDVFKDVYVLVYYPWNEEYEMIKSIWNELAKNLYYERNNIILASYNVLENEVLNTEFKSRNDYPEIILYRSQIDDIENNKKKIIMYRREAGVSYETLASWITYTSK
ncbi:hypothetical protein BCR36DRAFT_399620 [Piromyces finnis]|uniref:Thioredoxin domain-containing protein n=1 Tax=Piromyces finnis TaxID=1754191 RepID=A0A1Y1UZV8_9FUNG|nr:hypothetical protein BCR36DRAFT_399620 [Piromyces finnis]|eukprot:ORX44334.1 hypothetical protein BCR36DRAFT_399620 [Piromyces finnis]